MLTPPFELHIPSTLDEACSMAAMLVESGEEFDWIAGGTDLLPNYKWHINTKPHVISLANVSGLDNISTNEIGCMARLHDLAEGGNCHPLVALAAGKVASSLIRRNATLGGNLCLDTRCFWFNQTEEWRSSIDWCHKCDCNTGSDCRVIPNQNELCVATYQGDIAPTLMVLGATAHLIGPNGIRKVAMDEFYQLDGMTRNILEKGEFLLKVTLPSGVEDWIGSYQKLRVRESWDFPEAGVAAAWKKGDRSTLRVATTALESIPRMHNEEVAKSDGNIALLSDEIFRSVKPVNNTSLPPRYRRNMVKVLVKRACEE
ncbi:MAG: FAD binding domain-containing protein [Candidatus Poseidoniaceae archaeon]|jgi:4-hydroxybenzoyl-CoA reductase subunit beta|nr:FAD binding domain-containing protein [Candidatus Poseidoniaceae archaeon]